VGTIDSFVYNNLKVDTYYGDLFYPYVDVSENWIQLHYYMYGHLSIHGRAPGELPRDYDFCSSGVSQFHTPSEHTIDGKHADLEMQISFYDAKHKRDARVVILFDVEDGGNYENKFIKSLHLEKPDHLSSGSVPL